MLRPRISSFAGFAFFSTGCRYFVLKYGLLVVWWCVSSSAVAAANLCVSRLPGPLRPVPVSLTESRHRHHMGLLMHACMYVQYFSKLPITIQGVWVHQARPFGYNQMTLHSGRSLVIEDGIFNQSGSYLFETLLISCTMVSQVRFSAYLQ